MVCANDVFPQMMGQKSGQDHQHLVIHRLLQGGDRAV